MKSGLTESQVKALLMVASKSRRQSPAPYAGLLDRAANETTTVEELAGFKEQAKGFLATAPDGRHREAATLLYHLAVAAAVASGRADAGAGGYFGNLSFLKSNPNVKVKVFSDELLAKTSIAYAVPPREYFFRDWLNAVLLNLEENGKIKEVLAKWTQQQ